MEKKEIKNEANESNEDDDRCKPALHWWSKSKRILTSIQNFLRRLHTACSRTYLGRPDRINNRTVYLRQPQYLIRKIAADHGRLYQMRGKSNDLSSQRCGTFETSNPSLQQGIYGWLKNRKIIRMVLMMYGRKEVK